MWVAGAHTCTHSSMCASSRHSNIHEYPPLGHMGLRLFAGLSLAQPSSKLATVHYWAMAQGLGTRFNLHIFYWLIWKILFCLIINHWLAWCKISRACSDTHCKPHSEGSAKYPLERTGKTLFSSTSAVAYCRVRSVAIDSCLLRNLNYWCLLAFTCQIPRQLWKLLAFPEDRSKATQFSEIIPPKSALTATFFVPHTSSSTPTVQTSEPRHRLEWNLLWSGEGHAAKKPGALFSRSKNSLFSVRSDTSRSSSASPPHNSKQVAETHYQG